MTDHNDNHDSHAGNPENGKPRYDDINTPVVILVGVLSSIVTIATIALVQGLCYQWASWEMNLPGKSASLPSLQQIENQKAELEGTDGSTISISAAMDKVIADYGGHSTTIQGQ